RPRTSTPFPYTTLFRSPAVHTVRPVAVIGRQPVLHDVDRLSRIRLRVVLDGLVDRLRLRAHGGEVVDRGVRGGDVVQRDAVVVVDAHKVDGVGDAVPHQRVHETRGQGQVRLVHGDHRLRGRPVRGGVAETVRVDDVVQEPREVRRPHRADGHLVLEKDERL